MPDLTQPGGSGAGSALDLVKAMQEIAASGEIEVPDQVEFNGTLYVRATGLDAARRERDTWRAAQEECHELQLLAEGQLAQARARIKELEQRPDIEVLSALVHEAWMVEQQKRGRTTRRSQSGEEFMVPYDALSEEAKEFDRATVRAVLNALDAAQGRTAATARLRDNRRPRRPSIASAT